MKKVSVFIVLLFMTQFVQAQDVYICGDANGDFEVNITDAFLIALFYTNPNLAINSLSQKADVNGDEKIDIVDALLIAQYYVGSIDKLNCIGPDPMEVDLLGNWDPSTKVSFTLKEDEYVYNTASNVWECEIYNYNREGLLNGLVLSGKFEYDSEVGMDAIKMKSEDGVYPYYEISIFYRWLHIPTLEKGQIKIMNSDTDIIEYEMKLYSDSHYFSKTQTRFSIDQLVFVSNETQESMALDVRGEREKSKLLEKDILHTFGYDAYDSIIGLKFIDATNCAVEVIQSDMIFYIEGSYELTGNILKLTLPEKDRPRIVLPVLFEVHTDDEGVVYLERIVKNEPSLQSIAFYYGVTASNIESHTYSMRYYYSKYQN